MTKVINIDHVWSKLEPQLREHINDLRHEGYLYDEILGFFTYSDWTQTTIYEKEVFNYEHARFTLTQLCNTVELLTGSDLKFDEQLRERIIGLIEFEADVYAKELQEDEDRQHIKVIEEGEQCRPYAS